MAWMNVYMGNGKAANGGEQEDQQAQAWYDSCDPLRVGKAYANDEDKQRIKNEMFKNISTEIHNLRVRTFRTAFLRIAAVLVLVSVIASLIHIHHNRTSQGDQHIGWKTFKASGSSNMTVMLTDSTEVILKPGAAVAIAPGYNHDSRTTMLIKGEAFFEVKRDPQRPFIVRSGSLSVKVLGTAFTVEDDVMAGRKVVTVAHGKVQVSNGSAKLSLLTKGQRLSYNDKSFTVDRVPAAMVGLWSKHYAELDNASFSELRDVLLAFYHKELDAVDTHITNARFTLSIDRKQPAFTTLKIIAKTHGLNFYEKDGKIVLTKQK